MSSEQQYGEEEKIILPHHEQQKLCTTRLPYRQGRKLTAVKVYTITTESPHLLIFGVPSLKLRHELKTLLSKFGRLTQLNVSSKHKAEVFTETYHAAYDSIQAARVAKKMLDTKNFYGGSLHICYAPEHESIEETRLKLFKRRTDVLNRLKNLQRDDLAKKDDAEKSRINKIETEKSELEKSQRALIDMSVENTINLSNNSFSSIQHSNNGKRKQKESKNVVEKKFKPVFVEYYTDNKPATSKTNIELKNTMNDFENDNNDTEIKKNDSKEPIEVIDFTSTEIETLSNINEALNYNKFGTEDIRKIPAKPVNRIKFNFGNNKLI